MANYIKEIRKKVGKDAIIMPGVGAVIYKEGKILLQKRTDDGKWAIHGGAIELGESYLQALERELQEEINIKPIEPKVFGIYSGEKMYHQYPNGDKVYMILNIFWIQEYDGDLKADQDEVSEIKWFDINKLPENLGDVDAYILKDLKTYLQNKQMVID